MSNLWHRLEWLRRWASSRAARPIIGALVLVVSLLFLAGAIYVNRQALQDHDWHINIWLLLLAFALYPLGYVPVILCWHFLIRMLGGTVDVWTNIRLYSLSSLPKRIPGPVWYVASRSVMYKQHGVPHSITLTGVVVETICLMLSGLMTYLLYLALSGLSADPRLLWAGLGAIAFASLAVWRVEWVNRAVGWLAGRSGVGAPTKLQRRSLLALLAGYALAWMGGGMVLFVLARGVIDLPLELLPAIVSSWAGAGIVSVVAQFTVANLGLRELALSALLSIYLPISVAVVISLMFRVLLMAGEFVWSLILAAIAKQFESAHTPP